MKSKRRTGGRRAVVLIAGLVVASLAASASAARSPVELGTIGPAGGNGAVNAFFERATAVGSHMYFSTAEPLVTGDTDASNDIYERNLSTGVVTLVSTGPTGGNGAFPASFADVSAVGPPRVFFTTAEQLVSADTDASIDVYERSGGTTTLSSTGPIGGNGAFGAGFSGISEDGMHAFFVTSESLVSGDTDGVTDIYERFNGATTLVSGGNTAFTPNFQGVSADGSRVFFDTSEQLVGGDTDASQDVYQRFNGTTTLLSTGPAGGNGAFASFFAGASEDGTRVFLSTFEHLTSDDTDARRDFYERSGLTTTRLSTGSSGGNGNFDAFFFEGGWSADGTRFFFETSEQLESGDTDSSSDVYQRFNGQTTLVSTGPAGGNSGSFVTLLGLSADGLRAFLETGEGLVAGDTDGALDIYERNLATSVTTLVSTGPAGGNGAVNAEYGGISTDGSRVFFRTSESLVSGDTDTQLDVYERAGGETTLISIGPSGGNANIAASFEGVTDSGSHVFFDTLESLVPTDTDTNSDVYVSRIAPPAPPSGGGGGGGGDGGGGGGDGGGGGGGGEVAAEVPPAFTGAVAAQVIEGDRDGDGIPDSQDTSDASAGPVLAESVVVQVVSGEVFVRRPGGSPRLAGRAAQVPAGTPEGFVPVRGAEVIPVGSVVHTLRGRVGLTSVAQVVGGNRQTQRADFYDGVFQIKQARARRAVTELVLRGSFAQVCGSSPRAVRGRDATAAQQRSSRRVSRLWGDGRGRFRSKGRYSSATVRGTVWLTENRCDGTLTRVRRGSVTVRDFTARRTVTVRAGGSYLARAQRATARRRP